MAGRIFINYRREDDPGFVHAIFQRLEAKFGRNQLFMDVEGYIKAGDDFVALLDGQVAECDVFLVVIGPRWLAAKDQSGRRRLDNDEDFVRLEIDSAFRRGKRVIPVLVNSAQMPSAANLPDQLRQLSRRHAVRLSHDRFAADCDGLVGQIQEALASADEMRRKQIAARPEFGPTGGGNFATGVQQSVARIQEASQVPPLAPPEYRQLFEIMAKELTETDLIGVQTLSNITQRARERGLDVRRDDVRFVLEVVSEADPWFEQGTSAKLFAGRFRNFVVARCRKQGLSLSHDELDLVDAWFVGGTLRAA